MHQSTSTSTAILALKAFQDNYIWIIQQRSSFICIDPGDAAPVLDFAAHHQLTLKTILITHYHADHIGGVKKLVQQFPNALVYTPENTPECILEPPYQFNIIQTPGHTKNHICYFEPNQHWLFCGDTLFSAGCGRVFDGSIETLFESINRLKKLPDDTKVYAAHEYTRQNLKFALTIEPNNQTAKKHLALLENHPEQPSLPSTIGFEKQINPFFRLEQRDKAAQTEAAYFKYLRHQKDYFTG